MKTSSVDWLRFDNLIRPLLPVWFFSVVMIFIHGALRGLDREPTALALAVITALAVIVAAARVAFLRSAQRRTVSVVATATASRDHGCWYLIVEYEIAGVHYVAKGKFDCPWSLGKRFVKPLPLLIAVLPEEPDRPIFALSRLETAA